MPTGQPVQLTLISQDVFHSFSIPAFRVKREAIPGRYTTVWFEATTPGTYHLFCTQYCGTNHSQMIGDIVVLTPDDFKKWLAGSTSGMSLAQNGERLFASLSCNACHNARPDARGPSLANVYGSKLTLSPTAQTSPPTMPICARPSSIHRSTSPRATRPSCPRTRARSAKKA